MSKIPIDKNGKSRSLEFRSSYSHDNTRFKNLNVGEVKVTDLGESMENRPKKDDLKEKIFFKPFATLIPKMNLKLEKVVEQKPQILDLREKLNGMTKKQDRCVDKKTKSIINDFTQHLDDDKDRDASGPYSLLFDLKTEPSSSKSKSDKTVWMDSEMPEEMTETKPHIFCTMSNHKNIDRPPNVLNFDEKPMNEYEYSCEKDIFPNKKSFSTHSRSDLCLQLKSHIHPRTFETNLSPSDNSMSRNNEENSLDDSLGILTPDQMDDICYLDNAFSPTVEGLPIFCDNNERKVSPDNGDTPSTDKTESNSAASTIQNDGFENVNLKHNIFNCSLAPIATLDTIEGIIIDDQPEITYSDDSIPNINENASSTKEEHITHEQHNESTKEQNDFIKDDYMHNLEEEFLPSIHGSILEPASSLADTTVNLEIPLDCKLGSSIITNRIEQTPSPEELPLDTSDVIGEISTYSQFSASTLHDSHTYSDSKNEFPKSMETSKVSNSFITSITSITSLDGYQGDGEMSRPVSRSADHHNMGPREDAVDMDWQNVPVTRRADPMTDSDFFTESDADGLDEHVQRGDRRAQIIDGALYGGKNGNANPPLIVNRSEDSCMESSGVYTDFENHRASPVFLNVIHDMSPVSTTSTRSDCSQKNLSPTKINTYFAPHSNTDMFEEQHSEVPRVIDEDETPKNISKRNSLNSEKDSRPTEKIKEEKRSFTLKKYKMPKRDVPSKLKTMLSNRKTDADNSVQSSPKAMKKNERRESFLKKGSVDLKCDYKTKSFKDIKSKVDCSFSLQRSQTACSVTRIFNSKSNSSNTKPKSRHMRIRMDVGSANASGKSSLHSSQSDISASSTQLGKHTTTRFPLLRNGKKRDSAPTPTTPGRLATTPPQPPPVQAKKNGVVQKLSSSPVVVRARTSIVPPPSPRKPTPLRVPAQRPNTLSTTKEPPRVSAVVGPRSKRAQTPQQAARAPAAPLPATLPAPLPAPLPASPPAPLSAKSVEQTAALAHASKGVEALGVLVQYLVFRLDALNGGSWRAEAERWRGVAAAERSSAARADRDRQQRAQKDLDTIAECLSKISELEMEVSSKEEANVRLQAAHIEEVSALASDIKDLKDTIGSLKHEVAESRARLHAHSEIERTLRAQLDAARAEAESAARAIAERHARADENTSVARADVECVARADAGCVSRADAGCVARSDIECVARADGKYLARANAECVAQADAECVARPDVGCDARPDVECAARPIPQQYDACAMCDAACDPVHCETEECELRLNVNEELSNDATELAAEVRSLRAVIELKQAEMASLREARASLAAERERRAAAERDACAARHAAEELRERAAARQRDADRLRDDNRRLRDAAARDRDHAARLAALNEELRYKLRQKSQVVSLLAGGGYIERAAMRTRTSSGSSARSASPAPDSPSPTASPAPDSPPLPAVKGVVEKHDSVSWVLEIEETPEEVASRLARRSSFRAVASPGGVKRRGGGSPGSGSPAPASPAPNASKLFRPGELDFPPPPPPLKESAGEAIYIYDDRQY